MFSFLMQAATEQGVGNMPPLASPSVFKLIFSFVLLLAVLFIVIWILRKISGSRGGFFHSDSGVKVLEKKALSHKTVLYVVEFENQKILVSESANHIKMQTLPSKPEQDLS